MSVAVVHEINAQRVEKVLTFAHKAIMMWVMSLNMTRVWEEQQFNPDLQNIMNKYSRDFENPDDRRDIPH